MATCARVPPADLERRAHFSEGRAHFLEGRSLRQRLAVEDAVAIATLDLDPAEACEQRQRLVDALAARAHEPGEVLLRHRQPELVGVAGDVEQSLRRARGDVEE